LIGWTRLRIGERTLVSPEIKRLRAVFALGKINEVLIWERTKEQEKDVRFVELGEYLCEVRSKQYWGLKKLQPFDEFLAKRPPQLAVPGLQPIWSRLGHSVLPFRQWVAGRGKTSLALSRGASLEGLWTLRGGSLGRNLEAIIVFWHYLLDLRPNRACAIEGH
jgi:hypothetical protein